MALETYDDEHVNLEVSQNERAKDDTVYVMLGGPDWGATETYEDYVPIATFKSMLKTMLRLDEQLENG